MTRAAAPARTAAVLLLAASLVLAALPDPALGAGSATATAPATAPATDHTGVQADDLDAVVADRLLVRWAPEVTTAARDRVLDAHTGHARGARIEVERVSRRVDALHLPGADLAAVAAALGAAAEVELVEPDRVLTPEAGVAHATTTAGLRTATTDRLQPPNDPLFDLQWGLRATGQQVGPEDGPQLTAEQGNDVRLLEAWEVTRGDPSVTIGVIDTIVDPGHPDLAGALVELVDVTGGAPVDPSHGTAVATVAAARAGGGTGMAGVAPEVGVVSIGAFTGGDDADDPGRSTIAWVVAGFEAAADAGVDVITASWVTSQDSPLLEAAVADAGVPVIAASGNDSLLLTPESQVFPAVYTASNLLTVTAIGPDRAVPAFANVGAEVVDVAAPGQLIVAGGAGTGHRWWSGTSFAVPHVAGALALARSQAPYASTGELVDAVRWTSRGEVSLLDRTTTAGTLDAAALVTGVQRPVCRPDLQPPVEFTDLSTGNVHRSNIACLAFRELLTGRADGSLRPADAVTREQVASLLDRILSAQLDLAPAPPAGFVDVDPEGVHAPASDRLALFGILQGDRDGRFNPRAPVTRGQLASLLVATYDLIRADQAAAADPEEAYEPAPASRAWFQDTPGTTHANSVHRARDLGLVAGTGSLTYDPGASTRRDQLASLLARFLDALGREGVEW